MIHSAQPSSQSTSKIEHRITLLTHELLKSFKMNELTYLILRLIEVLQLIHFTMRTVYPFSWTFSFTYYLGLVVNYISIDGIIVQNPSIYQTILIVITVLCLVVVAGAILISLKLQAGVKTAGWIRLMVPLLNFMIFLFKTILQIPCLQVILIGLIPKLQASFQLQPSPILIPLLSSLSLIGFLLIQVYIMIFFHDYNMFSDIFHAGQSITRCFVLMIYKILVVVYGLIDVNGSWGSSFCMIFTAVNLGIIMYSHWEIGYYKQFIRNVSIRMHYVVFSFAFLASAASVKFEQLTTFTYLIIFILLLHLIANHIEFKLHLYTLQTKIILIKNQSDLQNHILHLIRLVDNMEKRESRIELEGYLNYHKRQCKSGEKQCECQRLIYIKERDKENAKFNFFKFVVGLLLDSKRKFPHSKKIYIMLSFIYHCRIKNPLQAIYSITKILQDSSIIDRIQFFHNIRQIQDEMKEIDQKENINKTCDVNKFFSYSNSVVTFEKNLETCTRNHIQFWKQLLQVNTNIKRLEEMGTDVTNSKEEVREEFQSLLLTNANNIHTLVIYGNFLIQITNQEQSNVKYLEKAQSIMKNLKESSKIDQAINKYNDNAETTVVVISANEGQIGTVIYTNNFVKKLIGYNRYELLGQNVAAIMPKIFGQYHNTILSNYVASSNSKVNGTQRIVTALRKDGYLCPVTALTKVLPNLTQGIQIVGFISPMQEKATDQQQLSRRYSYILYRCDNELVVGISQSCYTDFNIPACLVYGNPQNSTNQLSIKHLFGVSFQKSEDGQIASAMDVGEVLVDLNTTHLKDQFIITKQGSSDAIVDQLDFIEKEKDGVSAMVVAKTILNCVYNKTPLKLISFYVKEHKDVPDLKGVRQNSHRKRTSKLHNKFQKEKTHPKKHGSQLQGSKFQTDDMKDLKDFKNFISVKSEPSAISNINLICMLLLLVLLCGIIGLLLNWFFFSTASSHIQSSLHQSFLSQLIIPQLLFQFQKLFINQRADLITTFPPYNDTSVRSRLSLMIEMQKSNEISSLSGKYWFDKKYAYNISEYEVNSVNQVRSEQLLIDEVLTDSISLVQTLLTCNLSALSNATFPSTATQSYLSLKYTTLYSLIPGLNSTTNLVSSLYNNEVNKHLYIIYACTALMVVAVIGWFALSVPYVLSVTKINNRVLSLFCFIPLLQINRLITRCLKYMKANLTQAIISTEQIEQFSKEESKLDNILDNSLGASQPQFPSPPVSARPTQSPLRKVQLQDSYLSAAPNVSSLEQKFERMINAQDDNRQITIIKFLLVSILIIGYIGFNYGYAVKSMNNIEQLTYSYQLISRRAVLFREIKLFLIDYLINPALQPLPAFPSIHSLNQALIVQSYNLQANLLKLSEGNQQGIIGSYNTNNLCSYIGDYQQFSLFGDTFDVVQCSGISSGILLKGIKTTVVTVLEEVRAILANTSSTSPSLLNKKIPQYEKMVKYIENPILQILSLISTSQSNQQNSSQLVLGITSGVFLILMLLFWRIIWKVYIEDLNMKIWRTKGMLNIIPMKIITANQLLRHQFTSGQLEKAVR